MCAIVGTAMLLSAGACGAAESTEGPPPQLFEQKWIALTTTAMGVTGDVVMTPTTITFNGRVTFHLRYLSQVPALNATWKEIDRYWLYEVLDPRPAELRPKSGLCGSTLPGQHITPARYLAVAVVDGGMSLVAFKDDSPPKVADRFKSCGGYGYMKDRPDLKKAKP